ncbi:hypothetical protein MTBUT4_380054 [Magnetospirillum sp. UT-4]|nr:hypothetical protein MTBUT4_380054 [Magnetospirillum sp. UT-4]
MRPNSDGEGIGSAGKLSRPGAECRFPAAQLFPALAVVLAGGGEGGRFRARQRGLRIRARGPLAQLGHAPAQRHLAERVHPGGPAPGLHPLQRVPARPLRLPVLRRRAAGPRPDLRPRGAPRPGRAHHLGQRGRRLQPVQPEEGRPAAAPGRHASAPLADRALDLRAAGERPLVPAQLPAPVLARLPVLGHRAGAVLVSCPRAAALPPPSNPLIPGAPAPTL